MSTYRQVSGTSLRRASGRCVPCPRPNKLLCSSTLDEAALGPWGSFHSKERFVGVGAACKQTSRIETGLRDCEFRRKFETGIRMPRFRCGDQRTLSPSPEPLPATQGDDTDCYGAEYQRLRGLKVGADTPGAGRIFGHTGRTLGHIIRNSAGAA
jgi:hypothetical protein